eukprot:14412483-Alexandrium_andersonii.AAC.1
MPPFVQHVPASRQPPAARVVRHGADEGPVPAERAWAAHDHPVVLIAARLGNLRRVLEHELH